MRNNRIAQNVKKANWKSKILKNKSKDMDSNFLIIIFFSKALRDIERGEKVAHWCWSQFVMTVCSMQNIVQNSKRCDYSYIIGDDT